jgi:hypothetical protein
MLPLTCVDNALDVFHDDDVAVDHLRDVQDGMVGQGVEKDALHPFADAAGAHGDGFGLVLDGVHRARHEVDRLSQNAKRVEHIFGRALEAEIHFKIGQRQPAGQVFEQQRQVRCMGDGGGELPGRAVGETAW